MTPHLREIGKPEPVAGPVHSAAFIAGREAFLFGRRYDPGQYLLMSNCRDYRRGWRLERMDCRDIKKRMPLTVRRPGK